MEGAISCTPRHYLGSTCRFSGSHRADRVLLGALNRTYGNSGPHFRRADCWPLTAGLPVIFSAFTEGLPGFLQLGGFLLALLAITLISRPEKSKGRPEGIGLALLAGVGFGCFFILISRVNHAETFWPLAVARFTSVLFLLIVALIRQRPALPRLSVAPLVLLAGILDAFGNVFFVLATHTGRLDVAAVLASLYPAATVILAALLLRERVTRIQAIGILLALVAVPMISV